SWMAAPGSAARDAAAWGPPPSEAEAHEPDADPVPGPPAGALDEDDDDVWAPFAGDDDESDDHASMLPEEEPGNAAAAVEDAAARAEAAEEEADESGWAPDLDDVEIEDDGVPSMDATFPGGELTEDEPA